MKEPSSTTDPAAMPPASNGSTARSSINSRPVDVMPYLQLACYLETNRIPEMESLLRTSLAVKPSLLAYPSMGDVALRAEPAGRSGEDVQRHVHLRPLTTRTGGERVPPRTGTSRSGPYGSARQRIAEVLRLKPDHGPAVALMAEINGK